MNRSTRWRRTRRPCWRGRRVVGIGVLAALPMAVSGAAAADDQGTAVALIMGGTGITGGSLPSGYPTEEFFTGVVDRYINPAEPFFTGQPVFPGFTPTPLATPEQQWPVTGLHDMTVDQSISQGVVDLDTAITQTYAGSDIVVLGYSQSALVATLEMRALAEADSPTPPVDQHFVLLGDPANPNGGMFVRQAALPLQTLPDYYAPTPADTPFGTDIYTMQYDGYADFPRYPINLLADINAGMGMVYAHRAYSVLPADQLAGATQLATSPGYDGDTTYFMIPSSTLPLLEPLHQLGQEIPILSILLYPIVDLTEPGLKYLVDLGYDDPFADSTYADIPTQAALLPGISPAPYDPSEALTDPFAALSSAILTPLITQFGVGVANLAAFAVDPSWLVADLLSLLC